MSAGGFTRGVEEQLAVPGAVAAATDQLVRSWFLTLLFAALFGVSLFRLFPAVGRFTMTIAMGSVYRDGKPELLPVPGALAVMAAWLLLAGAAGYALLRLRDVG